MLDCSISEAEMTENYPAEYLPLSTRKCLTSGVSFEQYTSANGSVPVCADLTDKEIINDVLSQCQSHDETLLDDNNDNELHTRLRVTIFEIMTG
jgi:hypothetical protein